MSNYRERIRRMGVASLSALALGVSAMAVGACDDLEPTPIQHADEDAPSPHPDETDAN